MIEARIVEQIKRCVKSVTLLQNGGEYEVSNRDGIFMQYWRFKTLKEALEKYNIEAEKFCEND